MPSTMDQMVEAAATEMLVLDEPGERLLTVARAAIRAALPTLAEALGDRIWIHDVTANNVRAFISEIMEGK